MSRIVYYHHPSAENFSLRHSSESPQELRQRNQSADAPTKLLGYPFDTPIYVRYVGDSQVRTAAETGFDQEKLTAEISTLPEPAQVVAFRLVELLKSAAKASGTDQFRLYKQFDPESVADALDRVSWGAELPRVAGELMSNLILQHSLPNANHRTSIVMLQFCIETVDSAFQMPQTGRDEQAWSEWVDPYISDSKRLLTVRRNNLYFKSLIQLSVDVVERKGGIQIPLSEYELDMSPSTAKRQYAEEHEQLCRDFTRRVLEEAQRTGLCDAAGPSIDQFVTYLNDHLPERDPSELF